MKRNPKDLHFLYRDPSPGELTDRILFRVRTDGTIDPSWLKSEYSGEFYRWGQVLATNPVTRTGDVQTDDAITHRIVIRTKSGIDTSYEAVCNGTVYRVKESQPLNNRRQFMIIYCTELRHGDN